MGPLTTRGKWVVMDGWEEEGAPIAVFATEQEAIEYIATLPQHGTGRYDLDWD